MLREASCLWYIPLAVGKRERLPTAFPPSKGESAPTILLPVFEGYPLLRTQAVPSEAGIPPSKGEMSAAPADEGDVFPATGRLNLRTISQHKAARGFCRGRTSEL